MLHTTSHHHQMQKKLHRSCLAAMFLLLGDRVDIALHEMHEMEMIFRPPLESGGER
jgi:hypothetical protein